MWVAGGGGYEPIACLFIWGVFLVVPNALSKTPSRLAGDVGVSGSQIFALLDGFLLRIRTYSKPKLNVDGHLRLRTPYPVRSAKLSSLKLG